MTAQIKFLDFDCYKVLNIEKTATKEDVARAYRRLTRQYHPDKNRDDTNEASEKFQKIKVAKTILTSDLRRKLYDGIGRQAFNENGELHALHTLIFSNLLYGDIVADNDDVGSVETGSSDEVHETCESVKHATSEVQTQIVIESCRNEDCQSEISTSATPVNEETEACPSNTSPKKQIIKHLSRKWYHPITHSFGSCLGLRPTRQSEHFSPQPPIANQPNDKGNCKLKSFSKLKEPE